MTSVGVYSDIVEGGVPVLAAGCIVGRVDCVQRAIYAVVVLVEVGLVTFLVCFLGYVKGFALLKVGPSVPS